jgi:DNA-binding CsgD family transcriptional regulator
MAWKSICAGAYVDASQVARLVDQVDDDRFDETLLDILQEKGPAAEVNGFFYAPCNRDPRPVSWCGRPAGTALRVDRYASGYHRFDPTLHSLPLAHAPGLTLVDELRADTIGDGTYRRTCFEKPAFSRKISVAHGDAGGEWTVLNIYLGEHGVGEDTVERLAAFGSLVAPFLRRRGRRIGAMRPDRSDGGADERVGQRLRLRFPTLTERERHVCALTMIGKSSGEIAAALGIKPATVITYRRRAYERLGVSSAASLVAEIL